jgi:large subunit ribosomal protein L17
MRHGKRFNHLGRTSTHRKSMLSNMASSLFVNKRINTTLAKAKELRKYVEPLITKAKNDSTHSRRVVFSYLQDKDSVNALFNEVVDRVANRPGGYTRIIKLGSRLGDNAEMAMIELVDFNDLLIKESEPKKGKARRRRRGGAKPKADQAVAKTDTKTEKKEEKTQSEEKTEAAAIKDTADAKVEEVQEEVKEEAVEAVAEEVKEEKVKVEDAESEEVKAEEAEEKDEKKAAKQAEKPEAKSEEAAEEVKAKAESEKKSESKKEEKKESEDTGKEESEK